jgi:plasmid stabilization system protein ParE
MTRLVHSPEAANDLEELVDFLLASRPEHAVETVDLVLDALSVLERHPLMGRPVAQGMRELVISRGRSGYLALYAFDAAADVVFVLAIKHQREQDYH